MKIVESLELVRNCQLLDCFMFAIKSNDHKTEDRDQKVAA